MAESDRQNLRKKRHRPISLAPAREQLEGSNEFGTRWRDTEKISPINSPLPSPAWSPTNPFHKSQFLFREEAKRLNAEKESKKESRDFPSEQASQIETDLFQEVHTGSLSLHDDSSFHEDDFKKPIETHSASQTAAHAHERKLKRRPHSEGAAAPEAMDSMGTFILPVPPKSPKPNRRRSVNARRFGTLGQQTLPDKLSENPPERQSPPPRSTENFPDDLQSGQRDGSSMRAQDRLKRCFTETPDLLQASPYTGEHVPIARVVWRRAKHSVLHEASTSPCNDDLLSLFSFKPSSQNDRKGLDSSQPSGSKRSAEERARAEGNKYYLPPLPACSSLVAQGPHLKSIKRSRSAPANAYTKKGHKVRSPSRGPVQSQFFAKEPGDDKETVSLNAARALVSSRMRSTKRAIRARILGDDSEESMSPVSLSRQSSAPSTLDSKAGSLDGDDGVSMSE